MKSELNKELVEQLNVGNEQFVDNVDELVQNLVAVAVQKVAEKSPFIVPEKCIFLSVNEVYTGAFTQLSEFDYFLGVENAQIEMNTKKRKNIWKYFWREFKASWRIGRKKYKKKKDEVEPIPKTVEKYNIGDFRHDVARNMLGFLSQTTIVYENPRKISIMGSDDFGTNVRINIYVGLFDSKMQTFKLYAENRNKFTLIKFGERFENLDKKFSACGDVFKDMIKLFNSLYSKRYNRIPNQILVESLLLTCPNNLYVQGDLFRTFVNVANHIRMKSPDAILSVCDNTKSIFEEKLITGSGQQTDFVRIIKMLDAFKY